VIVGLLFLLSIIDGDADLMLGALIFGALPIVVLVKGCRQ